MPTTHQGDEEKSKPPNEKIISTEQAEQSNCKKQLKIVKTITLLFGSKIWTTMTQSQNKKTQASINKMLRLTVTADWYISSQ